MSGSSVIEEKEKSFNQVKDILFSELKTGEELTLNLDAEDTLFTRFSKSKIRQISHISQGSLGLVFIKGQKKSEIDCSMTGNIDDDKIMALDTLKKCRQEIETLPDDPHIVIPKNHGRSQEDHKGELLNENSFDQLLNPFLGVDGVGILASGPVVSAVANSKGMNHWYSAESFYVDYSLCSSNEKAVKGCYAGTKWDNKAFQDKVDSSKSWLKKMEITPRKIKPGKYRVYLAPSATGDLLGMLDWCGVSLASIKQGHSAMKKLVDGQESFSADFSLMEDFTTGLTPRFNEIGELAPTQLDVIKNGKLVNPLVSSRTAMEYDVECNFANEGEIFRAMAMNAGNLKQKDILKTLDNGLYISNLWYLNWSDLNSARVTGMTRYACFLVENGQLVAPIEHMRFDESLYHALGNGLSAITDFRDTIISTCSYFKRDIGGCVFPGIIINDFNLTL